MLTVLLYIVVILLAVVVVLLTFASTRPNDFTVKRSTEIKASPDKVFPLINDFRQWPKWSPWEKLDPNLRRTLSGAESGRGSVYEWEGNKQVGAGRMEILDSVPPSRIDIRLSFLKPFKAENRTIFTITPSGGGSNVLWEMTGTNNLMFKVMGLFMSMDKMVGGDFEKGLAAMKAEAERGELPAS